MFDNELNKDEMALQASFEKYVELTSTIAGIGNVYPDSVEFLSDTYYSLLGIAFNGTDYKFSYRKNVGSKAATFDATVWHKDSKPGVDKPFYTAYSCIMLDSRQSDLEKLAEDLSMATYKMHGGSKYTYTPDLINVFREQIAEGMNVGR